MEFCEENGLYGKTKTLFYRYGQHVDHLAGVVFVYEGGGCFSVMCVCVCVCVCSGCFFRRYVLLTHNNSGDQFPGL